MNEGPDECRDRCDRPHDLSIPLQDSSLQHGMLKKKNCESCKSHLNNSVGALSTSCEDLEKFVRQVCREELSLKKKIDSKIEEIFREVVKKY